MINFWVHKYNDSFNGFELNRYWYKGEATYASRDEANKHHMIMGGKVIPFFESETFRDHIDQFQEEINKIRPPVEVAPEPEPEKKAAAKKAAAKKATKKTATKRRGRPPKNKEAA